MKAIIASLTCILIFSISSAYADSQINENQGSLEVNKIVINDNGGTKKPQDFSFNLEIVYPNGTYSKQVIQFPIYGNDYQNDFPIGTIYKVTEDTSPNYDARYGNDCSGLVKPDSYCIVVNDDRSQLTEFQGLEVYKIVNNDHGGTKQTQDFSFNLEATYPNGTTTRQVIQFPIHTIPYDSDIPLGTTFKVTENPSPDYDTKYVGDCYGIVKTDSFCTVVNYDKPLSEFQGLEVQKIINNDHGGIKKHQDFSFNLEAVFPDGTYYKQAIPFPPDGTYESDIPLGSTFKVTENPYPGYDTRYVDHCSGIVRADSHCTVVNSDKLNATQTTYISIPSWIKNTSKWWSGGQTSDREFASAIGYLVQQKIISANVVTNTDGTILINDNLSIPSWIKNNAKWWSQGTISDTDFTSGIEYMVKQNIISFSKPVVKPIPKISDLSAGDIKSLYVASKWYELDAAYFIQINNYEAQLIDESAQQAWDEYGKTKDETTMKKAEFLEGATRQAKDESVQTTRIYDAIKTASDNIETLAQKKGVSSSSLDEAAIKPETELKDNIHPINSVADLYGMHEDGVNAGKNADTIYLDGSASSVTGDVKVDNQLGNVIGALSATYLSDHAQVDTSISSGTVILLTPMLSGSIDLSHAQHETFDDVYDQLNHEQTKQSSTTTESQPTPKPQNQNTKDMLVLVIGGKYYPQSQFRIGEAHPPNCDALHYHAIFYKVRSTDGAFITDPDESMCGFGKVGLIPIDVVQMTQDQIDAFTKDTGLKP